MTPRLSKHVADKHHFYELLFNGG